MTIPQFFETTVGKTAIMAAVLNVFLVALWFLKATRPTGVGRNWSVMLIAHVITFAAGLRLATHKFPAGPVLDRHGSDTYYYALILVLALATTQVIAWFLCHLAAAAHEVWREHTAKDGESQRTCDVIDEQNPYLVLRTHQTQSASNTDQTQLVARGESPHDRRPVL